MSEHDLIRQEREILRAFRQTTATRMKAESDAEAWRKAELSAAETKFQNAQKQAEAERTKAEADATARLKAERAAVETLISQRRQQADRLLAQVQEIYGKAYSLLKKTSVRIYSIMLQLPLLLAILLLTQSWRCRVVLLKPRKLLRI